MRKALIIYLITIITLTASFINRSSKPKGFQIIGSTIGLPDSTLIFLEDASNSSLWNTDSTFIINGRFKFEGFIKKDVHKVIIRTKNYSDYKFLWIENSAITFKGEKGKFKDAYIIGSRTQDDQNKLDSAINSSGKEKEQNILFIRNHPASIISANILSVYCSAWGRDLSARLYNSFSEDLKSTCYGKNILEFITLNKNLKVGDRYVDFSQLNVDGKRIKLSDYNGKFVLLEFWGSWCMPCRDGNPELVKTYNEFKNKGFEILGVASDSNKEAWLNAVKKDGLPWQNVSDLKGDKNRAALIYGVSYYPANFLIDQTGSIIAKDLRGEKLREKLEELL